MKRQNVLYPKAAKALKAMGENLRLARRRRKIAAKMMAERANMSVAECVPHSAWMDVLRYALGYGYGPRRTGIVRLVETFDTNSDPHYAADRDSVVSSLGVTNRPIVLSVLLPIS